jgi:hypothetical protein
LSCRPARFVQSDRELSPEQVAPAIAKPSPGNGRALRRLSRFRTPEARRRTGGRSSRSPLCGRSLPTVGPAHSEVKRAFYAYADAIHVQSTRASRTLDPDIAAKAAGVSRRGRFRCGRAGRVWRPCRSSSTAATPASSVTASSGNRPAPFPGSTFPGYLSRPSGLEPSNLSRGFWALSFNTLNSGPVRYRWSLHTGPDRYRIQEFC